MANKKCPKCGEDNPAEAVMCWACYTPLTASAGAAMGAGVGIGGAGGTATMPRAGTAVIPGADDGAAKKPIDPRIFFVAGGLLFAALIGAFTTGMIGGGGDTGGFDVSNTGSNTGSTQRPSGFNQIPQNTQPNNAPPSGPSTPNEPPPQPPPTQRWTMVVAPSPRFSTATFAIAPAQPGISQADATTMARNARQQYISNGKWTNMQIVVFDAPNSGQTFKDYMSERKGQPLNKNDYAVLAQSGAWNNAVVFYESVGNGEKPYYPSKNPNGWWGSN